MYFVGQIFGAVLAMVLFTGLVRLLPFSREDPDLRTVRTVMVTFIAVYILAGFGNADGRGFNPAAGLVYLLGAPFAFLFHRRLEWKRWHTENE